VIAQLADRVMVMRDGHVVEQGPAARVLTAPEAEYTKALIDAVPVIGRGRLS
jgi:ABC-type dipeptide/oligopeptide/nickel transport system ATPase component